MSIKKRQYDASIVVFKLVLWYGLIATLNPMYHLKVLFVHVINPRLSHFLGHTRFAIAKVCVPPHTPANAIQYDVVVNHLIRSVADSNFQ